MEIITGLQALLRESFGTAILIFLDNGICAAVSLWITRAINAGWLGIAFEQGLTVFADASIADVSDDHLNPAVAVALAFDGIVGRNLILYYVTGRLPGAFIGATFAWATFKQLFNANGVDDNDNPTNTNAETGSNFFTAPPHPNNFWGVVTEFLATFVLLSFILFGPTRDGLGPLKYFGVSFIIVSTGLSLNPPAGYAINPVRDLGLHLAYVFALPIEGKGDANRFYAWAPTVAPMLAIVATGALALAI